MAEVDKMKLAKTEFKFVCDMFENRHWTYDKDEDALSISSAVNGEDMPMPIDIRVDAERQLVMMYSSMPFDIPEDMRIPMAVAVACANCGIVDGGFDYDVEDGHLVFRITASFKESLLSRQVFDYMIDAALSIVDSYNDKFLFVVEGKLKIDQITKFIK